MVRAVFRLPLIRAPAIRSFFTRISPNPLLPLSAQAPRLTTNSRYFHRSPPRLSSDQNAEPILTLSQRLKHLIKSYGWYTIGVYAIFSVLDMSVAFAGIHLLGAEQVSRVVASIKESVAAIIHSRPPEPGREEMDGATKNVGGAGGQESLYAILMLAYAVHKTLFLPIRVGLTAAFTPKLVGWMTRRGWVGSSGAKRAVMEARDKIRNSRGRE